MRLRGVEPPRALAHTDLNRARLPVPPQPRGAGNLAVATPPTAAARPARFAKVPRPSPLSSRGLGRRILSPETGVRIPVAVLQQQSQTSRPRGGFFVQGGKGSGKCLAVKVPSPRI